VQDLAVSWVLNTTVPSCNTGAESLRGILGNPGQRPHRTQEPLWQDRRKGDNFAALRKGMSGSPDDFVFSVFCCTHPLNKMCLLLKYRNFELDPARVQEWC